MTLQYNALFQQLLTKYNLPANLEYNVSLPESLQAIVDAEILSTKEGITLSIFNPIPSQQEAWETQAVREDFANHFHVADEAIGEHISFMQGIYVLKTLANRFEKEDYKDIRFWYMFQPVEKAVEWSKKHGLHGTKDTLYINDRLSFYTRQSTDTVLTGDWMNSLWEAILVIDV